MKKTTIVLAFLLLAFGLIAIDYINQPVWVVRDSGSAFGVRYNADTEPRWRVQVNGTMQWGNGQDAPYTAFAPHIQPDGRVLYEFDTRGPVGIVLNDRQGGAISLTSERGCLVIRDERKGADHVIGIIGECEPEPYP